MHAIKGRWAGQVFALATSNDSGGKKSRIRRSKEERKAMVESFIKKFQKSNNGNFPSLNLTHKEVGGSFYTVREIVRDIIQENRVLAPPKMSPEEHDHSGFLEQHPLGSISVEPQMDLSGSDKIHLAIHTVPNNYQIASEENISCSNMKFHGSYPLELDNEQINIEVSKVSDSVDGSDGTSISHHASNHCHDSSIKQVSDCGEQSAELKNEFENEKIFNGVQVLEENPHSDESLITSVDNQDSNEFSPQSSQKFDELGSQKLGDEQCLNENGQIVDKTKEFGQRIHLETVGMKILHKEKYGSKDLEASEAVASYLNSNVVVEKFPLRPVLRTIDNLDGESSTVHEPAGIMEDDALQHDRITLVQSSPDLVIEKDEKKLPDSTVELDGEFKDEKVLLNHQDQSPECAKHSTASELSVLDVGDITDVESTDSSPDGTKPSTSTEQLISKDSTGVGRKFSDQDNNSLRKGNNPTLDRINLETWKRAPKKSARPEYNPLALLKAFIMGFVKFWTE